MSLHWTFVQIEGGRLPDLRSFDWTSRPARDFTFTHYFSIVVSSTSWLWASPGEATLLA